MVVRQTNYTETMRGESEQMQDKMKIAVVNMKVKSGDKACNRDKMISLAKTASEEGADLILFPEMCLTGYDFFINPEHTREEKEQLAETLSGETAAAMAELSVKYQNFIVYGAPEKCEESGRLYNSAFVTGPKGVIGTYRKIHPFGAENRWCAKGDTPFLFDTPWGPVGIGICYDTYQFPELMRYYVYKGARLYLNPTAEFEEIGIPGSRESFLSYYRLLDYGVLCNTIYIASANLTGYDEDTYFAGGSCVLGPKVTPFFETDVELYAGSKDNIDETVDLAELDLSLATRRLCQVNEDSGEMDYRPELYLSWR